MSSPINPIAPTLKATCCRPQGWSTRAKWTASHARPPPSDATETNRNAASRSPNPEAAARLATQSSAQTAPRLVATPFPPLKPR